MKYLFLILLVLSIISCKKEVPTQNLECVGGNCDVINNPAPTPAPIPTENINENNNLVGYFLMPEDGYIELVKLDDGRYWVYQQQILSLNISGSVAYHPNISAGPYTLQIDGTIRYAQNFTYSITTNNVEEDTTWWDISGAKRTEITLRINPDTDKFEYRVIIKNGTNIVDPIVVDRVIVEE